MGDSGELVDKDQQAGVEGEDEVDDEYFRGFRKAWNGEVEKQPEASDGQKNDEYGRCRSVDYNRRKIVDCGNVAGGIGEVFVPQHPAL